MLDRITEQPFCQTRVMRSVLVNADCFDVFPFIDDKSVNLILCDLPYGVTNMKWDSVLPFDKLWKEYERIITNNGAIVLTATNPFASALIMSNPKMFKYDIVWHKNCPSNPAMAKRQIMRQHELVLIFYKKQCVYNPQMEEYSESSKSRIKYSFNVDKKSEHYDLKEIGSRGEKRYPNSVQKITRQTGIHPTQKPLELMKYLIKTYSNEDDVVMDNCMGSNTTGLACKELNRQYIGIEKDKNYYDVSVSRVLS
jgi:site-specific DNA-methyltransferase (adenine-specific)